MRRLVLVRHGETRQNAERRMVATSDPDLSDVGTRQAEEVGRALASLRLGLVVTSPMLRCRRTTDEIVRRQSGEIPVRVDDRLRELGFGVIEGLTPEEIADRGLKEVYEDWRQGRPPRYPVGAETFEAAAERLGEVYSDVTRSVAADECAVLVGHSHALRILLVAAILGGEPEGHRRLRLDHASLSEVHWEDGVPRLVTLNVMRLARE